METTAAPANTAQFQRCRAVLTSGLQCLSRAMEGKDCCYEHSDHWFPTWPAEGEEIRIPLLEDQAAIRHLLTMVVHGVATKRLDTARARVIEYACQVARSTLQQPAARSAKNSEEKPHIEEPVVAVERTSAGQPMGERQRYIGPTGAFDPQWSFAKYMYERECEMYDRPAPTCAAEMPPSGWLTEEEMHEPFEDFNERNNARNDRLREQAQAWDLAHPEAARALAEERARKYPPRAPDPVEEDGDDGPCDADGEKAPEFPPSLDLNATTEDWRPGTDNRGLVTGDWQPGTVPWGLATGDWQLAASYCATTSGNCSTTASPAPRSS